MLQSLRTASGSPLLPALASRAALLVVVLAAAFAAGAAVAIGFWQVAVAAAVAIPFSAAVARSPFAVLLAWLLVVPYVIQQLTVDIHPLVWTLHRLGVPALLVLMIVYHTLGIRRSPFRLRAYDAALVLFLVAGVINILVLAPNPIRMLGAFYDQLAVPIAFFWLVRAIGPDRSDLNRLVLVGAWTIVVQATIGIVSWIAPSILPAQWLGRAGERTVGTFGGPAPYTITLVFCALLVLFAALSSRNPRTRLLLFGIVVAAQLGVVLSLSRGSWLGGGMAMLGIVVVYRREIGRFAIAAALLALVLVLGPVGDLASVAQERLVAGDTVEARIITNDASTRMILDKPLAGFGYGNFERFDEGYKQRVGDIPLILGGSAHNTYLNLLAELGIPATLLYLSPPIVLLALTFRLWLRRRRLPQVDWRFITILWLAIVDQFVVNNFLEIIHFSFWATSLWWLTLGLLAVGLQRLPGHELTRSGSAPPAPSW
ncbi:MAG: O-antigen ligase family protein [Actinomycetota bacterium]|nr:O-antigen ligase family protein [Actinomycetota bacterium]